MHFVEWKRAARSLGDCAGTEGECKAEERAVKPKRAARAAATVAERTESDGAIERAQTGRCIGKGAPASTINNKHGQKEMLYEITDIRYTYTWCAYV